MHKNATWFVLLFSLLFLWACSGSSGSGEAGRAVSGLEAGSVAASVSGEEVTLNWDMEARRITRLSGSSEETVTVTSNSYTFTGLEPEASHTFIIEDKDGGKKAAYAYTGSGRTQPGRISAAAYGDSAEVTWEALPGVAGYELYMSTDMETGFQQVGQIIRETSARVEGLEADRTYFFRVLAVYDAAAVRSVSSAGLFAVKPGYTFGEVTAVTPGSMDTHVRVFKAYEKGGKISFLWDALPKALGYNLYGSHQAYGTYVLIDTTPVNAYEMPLPAEYNYYAVSAVIEGYGEGERSQYVRLGFLNEGIDWSITGGIESVTVTIANLTDFEEMELACMGVGETEWLTTPVDKSPFTAGWLEPKDYDCKLLGRYDDNNTFESDTRRVTVYPYPTDEYLSVFVKHNTARLTWRVFDRDLSYGVLLSEDGGLTLHLIADDILPKGRPDLEYLIRGLQCDTVYKAYIRSDRIGETRLSSTISFTLDTDYCNGTDEPDPEEPGEVTELHPENTPPGTAYTEIISYEDKLYLFGGLWNHDVPTNELWRYDPLDGDEGNWEKLEPGGYVPDARRQTTGVVIQDKFYYYGGIEGGNNQTLMYDPVLNTWTLLAPEGKPTNRSRAASAVWGDKMYLFGGKADGEVWLFDPAAGLEGTWTKIGVLPDEAVYHKRAVTIGDTIYLFGGDAASTGRDPVNTLWAFDPVTYTFTEKLPAQQVPGKHMFAAIAFNDKMYIWAGDTKSHALTNDLYVYDPADGPEGSWTEIMPEGKLPSKRRGAMIGSALGSLYLFGGYDVQNFYNDLYVYKP